ncbi:MAG: RodZ domain-containing protein [Candidatus Acidiferrales bacterium]
MPPTPFGERLKRERELRGVSLDEVSGATRINTKYLEALETEQWDQLPGGVFNRGFIRTIARYLGINEDGMISEYALVTKDHPTVNVWVQDLEKPPRPWLPAAVIVLVIALIAVSGWIASKRWGTVAHGDTKDQHVPLIAPVLAEPASTATVDPSPAAAPTTLPAAGAPAEDNAAPAASSAAPEPDSAAASVVPAADALAQHSDKLELRVEAGRKARIRVIADGHPLYAGWIAAGETRNYSAREAFKISASDSSAIFLELNGKTMAPIGTPGRPGRATLTRKDLRDSPGGSH